MGSASYGIYPSIAIEFRGCNLDLIWRAFKRQIFARGKCCKVFHLNLAGLRRI